MLFGDTDLKVSPIDVNIPDLKGMLLLWKPTGPAARWQNLRINDWLWYFLVFLVRHNHEDHVENDGFKNRISR